MTTSTLFDIRPPQGRDEQQRYLDLRWEILHKPFGLRRPLATTPQVGVKPNSLHLAAFQGDDVMATGYTEPESNWLWMVYGLCTATGVRKAGFGRLLMSALEDHARKQTAYSMALFSRPDAIGFYLRLGYEPTGEVLISPEYMGSMRMPKMQKDL